MIKKGLLSYYDSIVYYLIHAQNSIFVKAVANTDTFSFILSRPTDPSLTQRFFVFSPTDRIV